jgi:hypothetical protein
MEEANKVGRQKIARWGEREKKGQELIVESGTKMW